MVADGDDSNFDDEKPDPVALAASVGAVDFLRFWRDSIGSFVRLSSVLPRSLSEEKWDVARWILSDTLIQDQLVASFTNDRTRDVIDYIALECDQEVLDLLPAAFREVPGFPRRQDVFDSENSDHPWLFGFHWDYNQEPKPWVRFVVDHLELGPKFQFEDGFFQSVLGGISYTLKPSLFLMCLEELPSDDERRLVVDKYRLACQRTFKSGSFFAGLERRGLLKPSSDLLHDIIVFVPPPIKDLPYGTTWVQHFDSDNARRTTFRAVVWAAAMVHGEISASHLYAAIEQAKPDEPTQRRPMAGARGTIRLLLFHGAPVDYLVRRLVLGGPGQPFKGFKDDVRDAVCWKRWISDGHIGGFPEELARMIMYNHRENWCV
jgi:hypothetical protein